MKVWSPSIPSQHILVVLPCMWLVFAMEAYVDPPMSCSPYPLQSHNSQPFVELKDVSSRKLIMNYV